MTYTRAKKPSKAYTPEERKQAKATLDLLYASRKEYWQQRRRWIARGLWKETT